MCYIYHIMIYDVIVNQQGKKQTTQKKQQKNQKRKTNKKRKTICETREEQRIRKQISRKNKNNNNNNKTTIGRKHQLIQVYFSVHVKNGDSHHHYYFYFSLFYNCSLYAIIQVLSLINKRIELNNLPKIFSTTKIANKHLKNLPNSLNNNVKTSITSSAMSATEST